MHFSPSIYNICTIVLSSLHGALRDVIILGYPPIDHPFSNLERMTTFGYSVRLGILFVRIDINFCQKM
jgi:hypothetical protein